jgi:hypothetical protein
MRIHANARTCPNSRRLLVERIEEEGWSLRTAAELGSPAPRHKCLSVRLIPWVAVGVRPALFGPGRAGG